MSNQMNKKNIFYLVVLFLTLISLIIATFSYYSLVESQKEEGTVVNTGKIEISYVDGYTVSGIILKPIEEPNLDTEEYVIEKNFTVISSGSLDQTITIYFKSIENTFSDMALKYAVYNSNNKKMINGSINQTGETELISNIYLAYNESATFTVLIWLDETGLNQESEKNKVITGTFNISAEQIKY